MLHLLKTSACFWTGHYACKNKQVQLQSHATFKFAISDVIDPNACKTLACSLIKSHLDYGNALLYRVNTQHNLEATTCSKYCS